VNKLIKEKIKAKPFLKWVGGKGRLLTELRKYYPKDFKNYFEPFVGGGAVFFDINTKRAYLNDINITLISTYKIIRDNKDEVIKILFNLEKKYKLLNEEKRKDFYLKIREKYNELESGIFEKSIYFLFLNKTCFNGMYRENSKGRFNVPFGKYKNPTIIDIDNIIKVSEFLKNVEFTSLSFEKAIYRAKKGDFIYFDPPYYPLNSTSNFTSYSVEGFIEKEQEKLKEIFDMLDRKGCYVMLSNSYNTYIKNLYSKYYKHEIMASRAINCKASSRGKIKEYIITNYKVKL